MYDMHYYMYCVLQCRRWASGKIDMAISTQDQECYDRLYEFIMPPKQTFQQKWFYFKGLDIVSRAKCLLCSRGGPLKGRCAECSGPYEKEVAAMIYIGFLCRELVRAYLLADMWGEIMWRVVG
jgi:hypothetical protein